MRPRPSVCVPRSPCACALFRSINISSLRIYQVSAKSACRGEGKKKERKKEKKSATVTRHRQGREESRAKLREPIVSREKKKKKEERRNVKRRINLGAIVSQRFPFRARNDDLRTIRDRIQHETLERNVVGYESCDGKKIIAVS